MSNDRDTTRIVRSWLEDGVTALPDRLLDAVLDALPATPQRRAPWLARRFPDMNNTAKIAMAAAVIVAIAFIGIRFLGPGSDVGAPQTTPSPTPTPRPLLAGPDLSPGAYAIDAPFPVRITFEVPAGWFAWVSNASAAGVVVDNGVGDGSSGWGPTFWIVDNVYADPCDPGSQRDPRLGPSVDDLVSALTNLPGYQATTPTDVVVSGFTGVQFELTAPEYGDECSSHRTWSAVGSEPRGMLPGETNRLQILDVDGVRLVLAIVEYAHSTEYEQSLGIPYDADAHVADQPELRQILDSVRIEIQP